MKLKIGDVVVLKSDSPEMTVAGDAGDGVVICTWFTGTKPERTTFHEEPLQLVERETGERRE
jgi:uncharacterized protein YodC (DUF2158 family)